MFTDEARQFIRTSLRSVWALELLLLMRRGRDRSWDVDALTLELRSSKLIVADALTGLQQAGLVVAEADGTWRYAPAAGHLDSVVQQIAAAYAEQPLAVSREVLAADRSKIQIFADAFRLKKD